MEAEIIKHIISKGEGINVTKNQFREFNLFRSTI